MAKTIKAADLFCGAGGTSRGLLEACRQMGFELDLIAVNHWPIAIASHSANHPYARHECASLDQVDPRKLVPGGRLNLLVASPECTHHSNARGGRPMNDQSRSSAWIILRWAELIYIENILIENVKEFRSWGPLGANGRPLRSKRGEFYFAFLQTLRAAGYTVEDRILNAADFGDPTTRERLFIIARRGGKKIIWPNPTHAPMEKLRRGEVQKNMFGQAVKMKTWVPSREIIDWKIPGQSIFNRKKPLAKKTLERIYAGLKKFGGPNAEPFLLVLRNHMDAQSLDRPLPTLAASGQHVGLVEPFIFAHQRRENQPTSVDEPIQTLTATSSDFALVEPFLIGRGGPNGSGKPQSVNEPLNTVLTENHRAVVQPFISAYRGNHNGRKDGNHRNHSVNRPLPTQDTSNRYAVVEPRAFVLPQHSGGELRPITQPAPTVCTDGAIALVEADAFLVDVNHGLSNGKDGNRTQSVNEPIGTITAGRRGKGVVQPCLVKYNGTATATSVEEPLHTVTAKDRYALVTTEHGTYALDIRLRMLRPHELAAAMSFPNDYRLTGKMEDQVKQIGNAVPVRTAQALCSALIS